MDPILLLQVKLNSLAFKLDFHILRILLIRVWAYFNHLIASIL